MNIWLYSDWLEKSTTKSLEKVESVEKKSIRTIPELSLWRDGETNMLNLLMNCKMGKNS